ncbi:MAG: 4Fe-4S binding protein [Methanobrevibacter boviskoreani]|uniref:4Fe-4S binding protein n=1 Tax=Methanobrevibacter boviskoreani TaxID=1348249 RepID=UPI002590558E|nr:4Fe-4S binding protein [uncultured Methanobrevibacter sp.]
MEIKSKENGKELKEIIKNQEFSIKVNYDKSTVKRPKNIVYNYNPDIIKRFKELSKELNVVSVGFTKLSPDLILNDAELEYDNAIVLVFEMFDEILETEPGILAKSYNDYLYEQIANKTYKLSDFLRENNVDTEPIHPEYDEFIDFSKIAAKANLGGIGRSGLLITPEYGPKVKISVILTSAKLDKTDPEEDFSWIKEYCKRCGKCMDACTYDALKNDKLHPKKCKGCNEGCSYCINDCPFHKKGYMNIKRKFFKYQEKIQERNKNNN